MKFHFIIALPDCMHNERGQRFGTRRTISGMEYWETLEEALHVIQQEAGNGGVWLFKAWLREAFPKSGATLTLKQPTALCEPFWLDENYDYEEGYQRFLAGYKEPEEVTINIHNW